MARAVTTTVTVTTSATRLAVMTNRGWNPLVPSTPLSRICWISTGVVSRPMATTTAMASVKARPRRSSGLARNPLRRTSVAFTGVDSISSAR